MMGGAAKTMIVPNVIAHNGKSAHIRIAIKLTQLIGIKFRKMEAEPEQKRPERDREGDQIPIQLLPERALNDGIDEGLLASAKLK
jgi:hypothetical protein